MSLFANELSMTETLFGGLAVAAVLNQTRSTP